LQFSQLREPFLISWPVWKPFNLMCLILMGKWVREHFSMAQFEICLWVHFS
jgi:hypothetical protein